jgi:hypothetical protein
MIMDKFGLIEARNASNIIRLEIQQRKDPSYPVSSCIGSPDFVDQVGYRPNSVLQYKTLLLD